MSGSDVTRDGIEGVRPDREAMTGVNAEGQQGGRRKRRGRRGEQAMVPDATFTSYYGKPIINRPVWESPDIPGYLYLGGLAGASSLLAAGAQVTKRPGLAKVSKVGALAAIGLGAVGLVHDLGRPGRFVNMLRTFKPTSPMSVGSWLLSAYGPAAGVAAFSSVTGLFPQLGLAGTAGAAAVGPGIAAYTAALISDTAVPAWHDGYREMPFVFVGSAATAAAGMGLVAAPLHEIAPARKMAVLGVAMELAASQRMEHRLGMVAEPYKKGNRGAYYLRAGQVFSALGVLGSVFGGGDRRITRAAGASLLTASLCTRWGIFHAGLASADDPKYTVVPQRERLQQGQLVRPG